MPRPQVLARRYRVLETLGCGAIAEVVRALDQHTGEDVALKVLYPALRESAVVVDRFRREVEIVRRIQDPHVLHIREVEEADGQLYLVMDYHPGGDLAGRLARQGPLDPEALRTLAVRLCGALDSAHRAGVVHRDVKPSNILVGPGDGLDVRLCDFGLARTAELSGLTTATAVLGTPEHMAPEVIAEGHADPRSDLYSLAVVLYEAATGRLPFAADSPYQLMRQHLHAEPPRARARAPQLPAEIDEAIARAMAKEPLDRFPSARAMSQALHPPGPAAVATRAAPASRGRACPACGGWLVELAATCADCGITMLPLVHQPGGAGVMVIGPGAMGQKLDAATHLALYRVLGELPAGWKVIDEERRAPRVPFYAARDLDEASATRLRDRLVASGLHADVVSRAGLWPRPMRYMVLELAGRWAGIFGIGAWISQIPFIFGREVYGSSGAVLLGAAAATTLGVLSALAARKVTRPLVRAGAEAAIEPPVMRLAAALPALVSRQDRRLVARLLERQTALVHSGFGPTVSALTHRAAEVAGALATLDEAGAAIAPAVAASAATSELRQQERTRLVLRTELLRMCAHLEELALAAAHAGAATTPALQPTVEALELATEAEEELATLLGRSPVRGPT